MRTRQQIEEEFDSWQEANWITPLKILQLHHRLEEAIYWHWSGPFQTVWQLRRKWREVLMRRVMEE